MVSSDTRILGRAAGLWHSSVLRFTDIAHQRSTLPLDWVLSSFDILGTGMWVFGLNLVPSGPPTGYEMFALFWNHIYMSH